MVTDPNNPYSDGDGRSIDDEELLPPDYSWWGFFDGVWRRLTPPVSDDGSTGS